jgi:hypothetical protein
MSCPTPVHALRIGSKSWLTLPTWLYLATAVPDKESRLMILELTLTEQRYHAVLGGYRGRGERDGGAERYGVSRQSVHTWDPLLSERRPCRAP